MAKLRTTDEVHRDRQRELKTPLPIRVGRRGKDPRVVEVHGAAVEVEVIKDSWHIEDRWWETDPDRQIDRYYWELLLVDGQTVIVFLDALRNQWFRHQGTFPPHPLPPDRPHVSRMAERVEPGEDPEPRREAWEPDPAARDSLMGRGGG